MKKIDDECIQLNMQLYDIPDRDIETEDGCIFKMDEINNEYFIKDFKRQQLTAFHKIFIEKLRHENTTGVEFYPKKKPEYDIDNLPNIWDLYHVRVRLDVLVPYTDNSNVPILITSLYNVCKVTKMFISFQFEDTTIQQYLTKIQLAI